MVTKAIDVDEKKWSKMRKWCINNDTTLKKWIDDKMNETLRGG